MMTLLKDSFGGSISSQEALPQTAGGTKQSLPWRHLTTGALHQQNS